jgi:hypothetical protein
VTRSPKAPPAAAQQPQQQGSGPPADGLVPLRDVAAVLGVGTRTLERYHADGVIRPARPSQGSHPALWAPLAVARALLAQRQSGSRDRRELAQAKLLELRFGRESGELLNRTDVIRRGQAVAKAVAAHLLALPAAMVRGGVVPPEGEAALTDYIRERLDELSRLESLDG